MKTIDIADDLQLRALERSDARAIFEAIDTNRAHLGTWLPFVAATYSIEESEAFVRSVIDPPGCETNQTFVIECDAEFAGLIGLKGTDWENAKTELGYWLCERFVGRGLITRSARCLCERAFVGLGLNRIQLRCAVGNVRSRAVALRLGLMLEGIERDAERFDDGRFIDAEVFSLLRRDWAQSA
ncbi:MAG: GNAT family N-acetyltransferase [Myxococcales bacterium]|jgi:ribosomal-protein-serine acetyltransferase|nr:GNAT family N-acetyltransferase [Myxococcales bacterium]